MAMKITRRETKLLLGKVAIVAAVLLGGAWMSQRNAATRGVITMPFEITAELVSTDGNPLGLRGQVPGIRLTVRNVSNQYELFQQMSCSWGDNWRSDNSSIVVPGAFACTANSLQNIILPPGQSYQTNVCPLNIRNIRPGGNSFRLGLVRRRSDFTSAELKRIYHSSERHSYFSRVSAFSRFKREEDVYWSNQVRV